MRAPPHLALPNKAEHLTTLSHYVAERSFGWDDNQAMTESWPKPGNTQCAGCFKKSDHTPPTPNDLATSSDKGKKKVVKLIAPGGASGD